MRRTRIWMRRVRAGDYLGCRLCEVLLSDLFGKSYMLRVLSFGLSLYLFIYRSNDNDLTSEISPYRVF